MKTRASFPLFGLLTLAGLSLGIQVKATTVGLAPNTTTSYGVWDTFPAGTNTFTGRGPDASGAISAPLLSVTSGGIVLGGGDRLYLAGAASNWTATGTTGFAAKSVTLQLKNYNYTSQSITSFFSASLTLGGTSYGAPNAVEVSVIPENGVNDEIVTYTWSQSLAANTAPDFSVNFSSVAGPDGQPNISIDGFDVSVNPTNVPEPSTAAVAVVGGLAMAGTLKRFRLKAQR